VLNKVDPGGKLITFLFSRESCVQDKGCFVKDLRIIRGRDLSQVVIVDNSTMSFIYQLENGIPIIPFYSNDSD
jgi:CTD small phosphatase-like protein 2